MSATPRNGYAYQAEEARVAAAGALPTCPNSSFRQARRESRSGDANPAHDPREAELAGGGRGARSWLRARLARVVVEHRLDRMKLPLAPYACGAPPVNRLSP